MRFAVGIALAALVVGAERPELATLAVWVSLAVANLLLWRAIRG